MKETIKWLLEVIDLLEELAFRIVCFLSTIQTALIILRVLFPKKNKKK